MRLGLPAALHLVGQATRIAPMIRFARQAARPGETQHAKLLELLRTNADTEYGRRYGFSTIASQSEYAKRVPLVTPRELEPYVARLLRGERNVLTAEPPIYYTRTTGSGGAYKHIPITRSYKRDFQKTVHVALGHLYRKFPAAFLGRALYFVGSRRVDRAPDGNDIGTMSGFNFTELPSLLRNIYAWPYELFEVADLASRSYLALYLALLADVSLVAGIFPAPIVYLLRDLEARGEELARDLRRGQLSSSLVLTAEQRAFFDARAVTNARVAERLERAMRANDETRVTTAFPMLRLVYCWTTATAALYVPELRRRLGPRVAVRDAIFSATEGWCTIPMGDEEPGGPLAVDSAYYELIAADAYATGSRETITASELEDGKRYVIVLTTASGLYRYVLGDVLEVCGFYEQTPRMRFVRRAGAASNLVGENIDEGHVTTAVASALRAMDLDATWFSMAPRLGDPPRYALYLELRHDPDERDDRFAALGALVDAELCKVFDYGRVRKSGMLAPIAIERVPPRTYDRWRQARLRDGSAEAQLKTTHLVSEPGAMPRELA